MGVYSLGAAGPATLALHYDDGTLLITDVTCVNEAMAGRLTVTLSNPLSHATVFGPKSYPANTGTTVDNLSPLGAHMAARQVTVHGSLITVTVPPVDYSLEWSSN